MNEKRNKKIIKLRKEGKKQAEIALIFGITTQAVFKICKNNGLTKIMGKPKILTKLAQFEGRDFLREKVRIRDKHTCKRCGKGWVKGTRRLDVHHTKVEQEGDGSYKNHDFRYLITYCHKCHMNLHSVKKKMRNAKKN